MAKSQEEIIRHWRVAEERLYPVVLVRADLYERYISVVRAVADELRSYRTPDDLVAAYEQGAEITARVVRAEIISTDELDLGLVAGAAFSLRYREVMEETHRENARTRIREARKQGEQWSVIYETGSVGNAVMPPYRRLEMRVLDGVGLHVFIETDPETGGPLFGVETVQLDPQTGDWVTDAPPLSPRHTFTDPGEWRSMIEQLREAA